MPSVEVWHAPTPLPRPVLTVVGVYDTFFHLVVVVRDRETVGWGLSGMATMDYLDKAAACAREMLSGPVDLGSLLGVEQHGCDTASRGAANAIACAAWDYAARTLGVACADLWGRCAGTDALDCYGSGFFLDATPDALVREAHDYRDAGFRFVKMRTGLALDEDLARFEAVAGVYTEPGSIAVDAVNAWDPAAARAFVERAGTPLLWIEDATVYSRLHEIKGVAAPIAAGESLETFDDLDDLRERGMQYALLDVQRLGGPQSFLRTAHALSARGARIGSHVYTPQSLHLLACVEDPLPVEVFDWSDPLFVSPPRPAGEGRLAVAGPGFGVALDEHVLRRHGELVVEVR